MKSQKIKIGGLVIGLTAFIVACGSQVVEFPLQGGSNKVAAPPGTEEPDPGLDIPTVTDVDAGCDCTTEEDGGPIDPEPTDDAGTPEEDSGTPVDEDGGDQDAGTPDDDAGNGGPDSGPEPEPEQDAGQPPPEEGDTCKGDDTSGWSCGHKFGCCVSSCAHVCLKKHPLTCSDARKCFKGCKAECTTAKKTCKETQ